MGRLGQGRRNVNSLTNSRAPELNSQAEKGQEAGGSEDERESSYDSIDPLRDVNATELRATTLIMRDGANRCNMGYENARKSSSGDGGKERERKEREREKVVERGRIPAQGPRAGGRMREEKGLRQRGKEHCTNQKRKENKKGKQRKKRQWWK